MTQMLEGLMQNDFPLTLNHIRRRLERSNHGAEVVTLGADGSSLARTSHAEVARAHRPPRPRAANARGGAGRACRDVRLEQPASLRAVLRGAVHGRGLAHAEHPAVRGADHLHRQPRRGQDHLRRRLARTGDRQARSRLSRPSSATWSWETHPPTTHPPTHPATAMPAACPTRSLRGADRGRRRRSVRLSRARRASGGGAVLHERHHR